MFSLLLTSVLLFMGTGSNCQPRLYTVLTIGANTTAPTATTTTTTDTASNAAATAASRLIVCESSPASHLLIRTAHYLSNYSSSSSSYKSDVGSQDPKWSVGCQDNGYGGCSSDHLFVRGDRMTSDDVMKVYRHCGDRQMSSSSSSLSSSWWCDAAEAGVGREFVMSYYCLEEPFINPCSNLSWELLADNASILFNYSHHTSDCHLSCQCTITSNTSDSEDTLQIQALNLFQEEEDGEQDLEKDVKVLRSKQQQFPDAESSVTEGCVGRKKQRDTPRVFIESAKRRWEVKRRAMPVQWQLKGNESSSLSLSFQGLYGIQFGRLWMDFKGPRMEISCGYTVQHGKPLPQRSTPSPPRHPSVSPRVLQSQQVLTYVGVGGALVIALTVVIVIAVAKCKVRARAKKLARPNGHLLQRDHSKDEFRHYSLNDDIPLGEYCTINDVSSASGADPPHVTRSPSRDDKPPMAEEEEAEANFSETSTCESGTAIVDLSQERGREIESEYGTLNHGPSRTQESNLQRSEPVIYDHRWCFGVSG